MHPDDVAKIAKDLGKQVTQAMQTLAMQGGKFEPTLAAAAPSAHGNEHVEFLVAGHAGTTPRPLAKVASGGELSRISLALSVIASRAARVPTLIFDEVDSGVGGAVKKGLLFAGDGMAGAVLTAFFISASMNLTFGPVFMAAHRMTDTYIDMRAEGLSPTWPQVVAKIDWRGFITFVVAKTIPFFWIPAHTATFLLPPEYRVLSAAYLSIALGAILSYARRRKAGDNPAS